MAQSAVTPRDQIALLEHELGLPANTADWYARQRQDYLPWLTAVLRHEWSFQRGVCRHCQNTRLTITGNNQSLCTTCLQTPIPWYPTGWVQPKITALVYHAQTCTSHS